MTVSTAFSGACGILGGGEVRCWGLDPDLTGAAPTGPFAMVDLGDQPCALRTDGRVVCWGMDAVSPSGRFTKFDVAGTYGGQWGCGILEDRSLECWAGQSMHPSGTFVDVSVGSYGACAVGTNGALRCWGGFDPDDEALRFEPPSGTYVAVSVGPRHACALRRDGTLACWGDDRFGQATPPNARYASVSVGASHTCGVRVDEEIDCWGDDAAGQSSLEPAAALVPSVRSIRARTVSVSGDEVCVIRSDGRLACWGVSDSPPTGRFVAVDTSNGGGCAIRADGRLACWGGWPRPRDGRYRAVALPEEGGVCAIRTDGRIRCWGMSERISPPPGRYTEIIADTSRVCGLRVDKRIVCSWSKDADAVGRLHGAFVAIVDSWELCGIRADGSVGCAGEPGEVPAGPWTMLRAGEATCGLRPSGELVCERSEEEGGRPLGTVPEGPFVTFDGDDTSGCGVPAHGALTCWGAAAEAVNAGMPQVLGIVAASTAFSTVPVSWAAYDPVGRIASYEIRYRAIDDPARWVSWRSRVTERHTSVRLKRAAFGGVYEIEVRARATDGRLSAWSSAWVTLPADDREFKVGRGWARVSGSRYYGGAALRSTRRGATLTLAGVGGIRLDIVATTCPSCGRIRISLRRGADEETGVLPPEPVIIDLRSQRVANRQIIPVFFDDSDPAVAGTLVVEVLSSGRPVLIDGVLIE